MILVELPSLNPDACNSYQCQTAEQIILAQDFLTKLVHLHCEEIFGKGWICYGSYTRTVISHSDSCNERVRITVPRVLNKHALLGKQKTYGVMICSLVPFQSIPLPYQVKVISIKLRQPKLPYSKYVDLDHTLDFLEPSHISRICHVYKFSWNARLKSIGLSIFKNSLKSIVRQSIKRFHIQFMEYVKIICRVTLHKIVPTYLFSVISPPAL